MLPPSFNSLQAPSPNPHHGQHLHHARCGHLGLELLLNCLSNLWSALPQSCCGVVTSGFRTSTWRLLVKWRRNSSLDSPNNLHPRTCFHNSEPFLKHPSVCFDSSLQSSGSANQIGCSIVAIEADFTLPLRSVMVCICSRIWSRAPHGKQLQSQLL